MEVGNVPPTRTLLELLRDDLHCTGTKEGCNEGDCGACTVVLGEAQGDHIHYSAVNSCIRMAHSVNGLALWTVEDLAAPDGTLHPAQQAMVDCHGSQCGFCTPGFVMSLFGMYQNHVAQGHSHHARTGAGRTLWQFVPLYRLPPDSGRRPSAWPACPSHRAMQPKRYKN